ncbi:MAG TPA: class I SAM-dependent methyltransferase, partial [Urbifossiella sp.]
VGAYRTEEQYRQSSLDRRNMLIDNGLTPDSRLLDVGCGTGQIAMALEDYLSDRGAFFGTDIGREAIDYCRGHFRRPNFHFAVGELTRLPFPTSAGPFDMAIFFSVFTHTHTDETALLLAETARLLGPKGIVIADVIVSDYVARGAGHRGQMWVNRAHFDQIAEATGFRCKLMGKFPWGPFAERHMLRLSRRAPG